MDSVATNKSLVQPKTIAELLTELPGLNGIFSKDSMQTLTAKKKPRNTVALTQTSEENFKPLSIAEMRAAGLLDIFTKDSMQTLTAKKKPRNTEALTQTSEENFKPLTIAEMRAAGLLDIFTKDSLQTLTAKKKPRNTLALTRTSEKNFKPLSIAEMRAAGWLALKGTSSRKPAPQPTTATKKKIWNSSVKVEHKTKSHTADGQMKHNPVRKALNFQPKAKVAPTPRTIVIPPTPKFTKPELRAKKTLYPQANNSVRISGVYDMPKTPVRNKIPIQMMKRMTLANKENVPCKVSGKPKLLTPVVSKKRTVPLVPDTPLPNVSCDTSFLQREKEVQDIEGITEVLDDDVINKNQNILIEAESVSKQNKNEKSIESSPVSSKSCSIMKVIKGDSPTYRIPKKNSCLRQKVLYKSMPNVCVGLLTPNKDMTKRAFNMYMEMKMHQQMNFLKTPTVKHKKTDVPDTPGVTSHNLIMQLDKIYKDNT